MFAEEEWTDSLPAEEQKHSVFKTETLSEKSKAISKRCLKRTLQTLGSVPKWDIVRASDSDGEVEEAPVHTVKKKKKCKKRKKISDSEGEKHGEVDVPETPVKKKKKQKKPSSSTSATDKDAKRQQKGDDQTQNDTERLSRQQWKNKMKSKKRCKNKFLQNTAGAAKVDLKEVKLGRTEGFPKEEKSPAGDLASVRIKSGEKSEFVVPVNRRVPKNDEATKIKKKKEKECIVTKRLQPVTAKLVFKQLKEAKDVIPKLTAAHEQPVRVENQSQVQAKTLKGHVTESNTILTEEKQETVNMSKDQGKNPFDRSSALRARMEKRLEAARFRYINELLYTSTSGEAKRMFKQDPDAIGVYHKGYTEQVKRWPANPVDSIISYIRQKPASLVVADFGCGDCKIARSVKNKVHCFDLAPVCELVTACDMANVPLADSTVDIAIFCLSLMGTNLGDFLAEANRVLVDGGALKIAEVASRFEDERQFIGALSRLGFKLVSKDTGNTHFYSFEFTKIRNAPDNVKKLGLQLKPCLYKKR